ncbi:unnamed protein product, partial [Mesorhabditis belari]|uniref:Uncharacterized protein n=1 Tax=Mesorhabditis belari TaxID=2138241 RepID=A0AAF3J6G8_9BILA
MARNDIEVWPYYRPDLVFIYRIIESSTFSLVFLVVIFYIRLLLKKEFCHPNLRFLLITQPICHICALALRPIRHTIDYFGLMNPILLKTINYFSDSLLTICFQIVLAYSVERIIAIKYVENYENRWTKRPTLGILLLIGSISSEQGLIMLWYFGLNNTLAYSLQYLFFITAAILMIQMVLTVVGQDCLKEELYLMIGRRHRVDAQGITTILGKPMVFTAEQANQVYFEQIQQSWDIVLNNNQTTGKAKYKEPT